MSELNNVVNAHLPQYRQQRLIFCGAPLPTMVRCDGSRIDGATYHCTDRFCGYCARAKSQRVYACILDKLKNSNPSGIESQVDSKYRMVTLTISRRDGLSGRELRNAIDKYARVQNETHNRLRRHDYCVSRHAHWSQIRNENKTKFWAEESRKTIFDYNVSGSYESKSAPNLSNKISGVSPASGSKTTYIWAREITAGGNGRGWHVHAHYLVPTESDAHRLISAHLTACASLGIYAEMEAQRISTPKEASWVDDESTHDSAARYITQYVTKSGLGDWSDEVIEAYIYGIYGLRQYDAGGRWRPLGIGKTKDDETPKVTHVEYLRAIVTQDGELLTKQESTEIGEFLAGRGAFWSDRREIFLNQYRRSLTTESVFDILIDIAINDAESREIIQKRYGPCGINSYNQPGQYRQSENKT